MKLSLYAFSLTGIIFKSLFSLWSFILKKSEERLGGGNGRGREVSGIAEITMFWWDFTYLI